MQNIDDAAHQTIYRLREADDWFASLPGEVQDKIIQSSVLRHYRKGQPKVQMPPQEVCINPIPEDADQETIEKGVNFPTHPRAIEKQVNY